MDSDVQSYGSFHSDGEGYGGRIDVVPGPTGRRRWPEHVKASIVLETYRDGVSVPAAPDCGDTAEGAGVAASSQVVSHIQDAPRFTEPP